MKKSFCRFLFFFSSFFFLSCGELPENGDISTDLEIVLSALSGDELLQFIILANRDRNGNPLECTDVTVQCIADQPMLRVHSFEGSGGRKCSFRIGLDLNEAKSDDGQPVSVRGIPPGSNYLLAVELLRVGDRGEERLGAGCMVLERITKGSNPPPQKPIRIEKASACSPAMDSC